MDVLDLAEFDAGTSRDAYDEFADLYDDFTWDHDYESWVATLEDVARTHGLEGDRVLDVACGTGKSVVPWLERGYRVVGCDVSERMLGHAAEKTRGAARLLVADMRRLPRLEPSDLVTCLGDAVNCLLEPQELARAFGSVAGQLRPGGVYLFDLNSLRTYREDFAATREFRQGGWDFRWTGHGDGRPRSGGVASATVTAHRSGSAGPPTMTSQLFQRHHPPAVVRRSFETAGLECVHVYGQHRNGALDPEFAELAHSKALFVARKSAPR
jgi:SAM-dependent methyltransferase